MQKTRQIITLITLTTALMGGYTAQADDNTVYDEDAEMLTPSPPIMPANAEGSGYCCMMFDLTAQGTPINIKSAYCTNPIFSKASKTALSKWVYSPAKLNGSAVPRRNMSEVLSFRLFDFDRNTIPGRTGYYKALTLPKDRPPPPEVKGPEDYKTYRKWLGTYFDITTPCGEFIT